MLSSWKEIAHFFGKGVRTVQRWEKTLDLPIHRPPGAPSNVVLARTSDLEEWMHRGPVTKSLDEGTSDISGSALTKEIAKLEQEVQFLAEFTGTSVPAPQRSLSNEERIGALTSAVSESLSKLAGNEVRTARAA